MRNKKRNRIMLLLILLLGVTIGFAALATTLKINGSANITKNTWSVYWDEDSIAVTQGSKGDTIPEVVNGEDGSVDTKVNWNVNLEIPGDFYEFTIDAVNAGTLDAMITGITPTLPQDLPSYVSYSVTYDDGIEPAVNHLLPKGTKSGSTITPTTEKYKVRIEFKNTITPEQMDAIPEEGLSLDFGYEVTYGQADDNAISKPLFILPQGKTKDNLSVGDELCIQDQCFNFIRYDGNDIVMLAKWNLKVGNIYSDSTKTGEYASADTGYGLQSSEVRGMVQGASTYNGTVDFSKVNYWTSAPSYPAEIYDGVNYAEAPGDNNYSVAYYVEQYKSKLINEYHATIKEARLLKFSEAVDSSIGCSIASSWYCPTTGDSAFITNTTYWIGAAADDTLAFGVGSQGNFGGGNYYYDGAAGVRPVIVIEKDNL